MSNYNSSYTGAQIDEAVGRASAHASRHASGGADAVTPASIGAAASSHTHTAASIGAAASTHTHTAAAIGAAASSHTHTAASIGAAAASHTHALASIGASGNRNLLDNWDFCCAVNQRGVSGTISTPGYFLDRWKLMSGSVTINSGSITLNGTIAQISEIEWGTSVTASTKMQSGTATIAYNNTTKTTTITSSGGTLLAAKLEIGSILTLANDPPMDFWAEFTKCRRFYVNNIPIAASIQAISGSTVRFAATSRSEKMRANPTFTPTDVALSAVFPLLEPCTVTITYAATQNTGLAEFIGTVSGFDVSTLWKGETILIHPATNIAYSADL